MANVKFFFAITLICFKFSALNAQNTNKLYQNDVIHVGAERLTTYLPLLKNKNVGMVVNQTSIIERTQTSIVDTLLRLGITIKKIFAPEHGFRGKADAGEHIENTVDAKTGVPIVSIYGKKHAPNETDLKNIDVLVFDIQDVGVRFYTYISTLEYLMAACAQYQKPLIILDRPNPNGHYVDGAVLNKTYKSFIGMQSIPIVYGMTIGEYATMLNGEKWLADNAKCDLTVITCENYSHTSFYKLPVNPSPNLPNMKAIYLYPSLCFFEGTDVSCGRGTNKQFQIYGSPNIKPSKASFTFTPRPNEGAKDPYLNGKLCYGKDLSTLTITQLQRMKKIDMSFLIAAYTHYTPKDSFFLKSNFFEKLAGTDNLRQQIKDKKCEKDIKKSEQKGIEDFKKIRKKYLLYPDFK